MVETPQNVAEHDDNTPVDVEVRSNVEEDNAPGNAGDDQDRTEEHQSGPEEDASTPEDSGGSELENLEDQAIGVEPDSLNNDDAIESGENHEDDESEEIEETEPQPRRSTRTKISTATTKYKDFLSKSAQPGWMVRADYLKTAGSSGMFKDMDGEVRRAMLQLITETDN